MICCDQRGVNSLAKDEVFEVLVSTTEYYVARQRWFAHLLLAMPDHLHALVSFPQEEEMAGVVRDWKRWTAKKVGIACKTVSSTIGSGQKNPLTKRHITFV